MLKHIEKAMFTLSLKVPGLAQAALKRHGFSGIRPVADTNKAAETFPGLLYLKQTRWLLPVWSGASDKTIYEDAMTNMWARAWHDCLHLDLNAEFDMAGERAIGLSIIENMRDVFNPDERCLLWAEVVGQAQHFEKFGAFPDDQRAFTLDYINRGYKLGDSYAATL
jgi:hypothetical protein